MFSRYVYAKRPARLHLIWIELLQRLADNRLTCDGVTYQNIMFDGPPRFAKSTYITEYATAWLIGRNPNINILMLGKTEENALKFSGSIRRIIESQFDEKGNPVTNRFSDVFPDVRPGKPWGEGAWWVSGSVTKDPTMLAKGIDGTTINARCDWLIADDLVDSESSRTAKRRQDTYDDFSFTGLTRLSREGKGVYVGNRWHEDDLFAKLEATGEWVVVHTEALRDGPQYVEVRYPLRGRDAQGKVRWGRQQWPIGDDRSAWPSEWPVDELERIREVNQRRWVNMFLGRPSPMTGGYYKRGWFARYTDEPHIPHWIQSWDTAVGINSYNDNSVCTTMGLDGKNELYVPSCHAGRWEYPELVSEIKRMFYLYNRPECPVMAVLIEQASSGHQAIQQLRKQLPGIPIVPVPIRGENKEDLASYLTPYLVPSAGRARVYIRQGAEGDALIEELVSFPNDVHDDRADSFRMGGLYSYGWAGMGDESGYEASIA